MDRDPGFSLKGEQQADRPVKDKPVKDKPVK
jgi:hypothetical protein